jgi:hypothetical protein
MSTGARKVPPTPPYMNRVVIMPAGKIATKGFLNLNHIRPNQRSSLETGFSGRLDEA